MAILLKLGGVDLKDVVLALEALVVREEDKPFGIVVKLVGGLLDDGEALIEFLKSLVAKVVGLGDVGRDILVGLCEPGKDWGSKGPVRRVAELYGPLGVLIGLDGVEAVGNERVVQKVLGFC